MRNKYRRDNLLSSSISLCLIVEIYFTFAGPTAATAADERSVVQQHTRGMTVYFGANGNDNAECAGGARGNPWRSLRTQVMNGCIKPGMRVVLLAGKYQAKSTLFNGRINLKGKRGQPVTVVADRQGHEKWPVQINGGIIVSSAEHMVIDGIDFVRARRGENVLAIGGSYVTIRNSRIRGLPGDYNADKVGSGDCVKIAGGMKDVHDVALINNEIRDCPQDAIDITGRRTITIRGNTLRNAWFFQIKGGADDILVENNKISNMRYGITGNGMDCSRAGFYCGSPRLPLIPVEDRFQARNVRIIDNHISNIARGRAIDFTGWKDVTISGNRIIRGNIEGGAVLGARRRVVNVFTDDIASQYCSDKNRPCLPCRLKGGGDCWRIRLPARGVKIIDNEIIEPTRIIVHAENGAIRENTTVCFQGNRIYNVQQQTIFKVGKTSYSKMDAMTSCEGFPYTTRH